MTTSSWPSEENSITGPEHLQAIGQFAILYNFAEEILGELFRIYFPASPEYSEVLFRKLNNRDRIEMLRAILPGSEGHTGARDTITAALRYFDICTENRNLVLHSITEEATSPDILRLSKRARNNPSEINFYEISLPQLRQVADDAANTFLLLSNITLWIGRRDNTLVDQPVPPLPKISAQPHRLIPSQLPKANLADAPPPQSSRT